MLRHSGKYLLKRDFSSGCAVTIAVLTALITLTHILRTANPGYEFRTGET